MPPLIPRTPIRLPRTQYLAHHLRRPASSTTTTTPPPIPQPTRSTLRPTRRALLYSTLGLVLGGTFGSLVTYTIAPPPHPVPGSREDKLLLHDLETRIDEEFKVRVLRGKCTAAAANLRGEAGPWKELTAGDGTARAEGRVGGSQFTEEGMAGARGLGVERVFWNEKDKELVAVVWFGGALSGWPGVVHGGSIATVLGEKSALAAMLLRADGEKVTLAANEGVGAEVLPEPRQLELTYKKPTYGNAFYVLRVVPRLSTAEGLGTWVKSLGREVEIEGRLETLDGKVCVETKAVVPVADAMGLTSETVKTATKSGSWTSWVGQG